MPLTAHVTCYRKDTSTDPEAPAGSDLGFQIDPADERNAAWRAPNKPLLFVSVSVNPDTAAGFESGQPYTLTIAEAAG